ncbi:hypothetical protein M885DRAFT_605582 [Pelagophyceae sp. CCMP2097]|nr:hypothetical protein M885DRAFT_605582 [Pelagophyceae sp. CCMP2097]
MSPRSLRKRNSRTLPETEDRLDAQNERAIQQGTNAFWAAKIHELKELEDCACDDRMRQSDDRPPAEATPASVPGSTPQDISRSIRRWLCAKHQRTSHKKSSTELAVLRPLAEARPASDVESVTGNSLGAAPTETSTDSATDAEDIVDAVRERVLKSDWRKKMASCKTSPAVAKALAAITPELDVETAKARTRDLLSVMLRHVGVNERDLVVLMDDAWFNSDALLEALLSNMGGLRFGVLVARDKKRGGGDINDITRGLSSTTSTIANTTAVNAAAATLNLRFLVLEEALTSRKYPEDDKRFFNKKTSPVPVTKDERDFVIFLIYSALFAACNARGNEIDVMHHMLGRKYKVTLRLESMALPEAVFAALKNVVTVEKGAKVAVFSGSPHFGGAGVRDGFEKAEGPLQAVCKCAEAACVNADKAGDKAELLSNMKLAAAAVRGAVKAAQPCSRRDILSGLFCADAVLLCAKKGRSHEVGEAVLASVAALRGKSFSDELASGAGAGYVAAVIIAAQSAQSRDTIFELPRLVVTDPDRNFSVIRNMVSAAEDLAALRKIVDGTLVGEAQNVFVQNPNVSTGMQLSAFCAEQASKEPEEREKPHEHAVVYLSLEWITENGEKVPTGIYVGTSGQKGITAQGALLARFKSRYGDIAFGGKDGLGKEMAKVTRERRFERQVEVRGRRVQYVLHCRASTDDGVRARWRQAQVISELMKYMVCQNVLESTFTACLTQAEAVDLGNRSTAKGGVTADEAFDLDDKLEALRAKFGAQGVVFEVDHKKRAISVLNCGKTQAVELKDAMRTYGKFCKGTEAARDASWNKHVADVDSQRAANEVLDLEKRKSAEAADGEKMRRVKSTSISAADLAARAAATTAVAAQKTKRKAMPQSRWTKEEDKALLKAVQMTPRSDYGEISGVSWSKIAAKLQHGRNAQTCSDRWKNAVDQKICKGTWGDAEYGILVKAHAAFILEWNMLTRIATALSGRFTNLQINVCLKLAHLRRWVDKRDTYGS